MKNKKYILTFLLLIIIILLTYFKLFNKKSIQLIILNINRLSIYTILICILFIIIYFLLHSIYMKTILNSLRVKVPFAKCIYYCLIEFYFSGITPSSTGGQPVQIYQMTKDKIPIRKSYITLMLNTIYFKLIILILGIISFFYTKNYLISNKLYLFFFILGIIVDLILVIGLILLIFKQSIIKKILKIIINKLNNIRLFNNKFKNFNINEFLKKYKDELNYIKKNKKIIIINFFITLVQRILLFSIAYILYISLDFNKYSYIDLLMIQISVQVSIEALPLPGGSGLSENMFKDMFASLFGLKLCDIAMIFTRAFSFYIPLAISVIVILFTKIFTAKKH